MTIQPGLPEPPTDPPSTLAGGLPPAWATLPSVGPGRLLIALGVGVGEVFLWPSLTIVFGPNVRVLFLVGLTMQLFVMTELGRYSLATGESAFVGAARLHPAVLWLFFGLGMGVYVWPGPLVVAALSIEALSRGLLPWRPTAIVGLIALGLVLGLAPAAYGTVEATLTILVGLSVIGAAAFAVAIGGPGEWSAALTGLFALSEWAMSPAELVGPGWLPLVVTGLAFAGPSGMGQLWRTLYLRDKRAGMGYYAASTRSWLNGEAESLPGRGQMFDAHDPAELERWRGWRRWLAFDATVLYWGATMLTALVFAVLALLSTRFAAAGQSLAQVDPGEAALAVLSSPFGPLMGFGGMGSALVLGLIAAVGWKMGFDTLDAFARGQAEMLRLLVPSARRSSMRRLYCAFLGFALAGSAATVVASSGRPATAILEMLGLGSAIVMGATALLALATNNLLLPRALRPRVGVDLVLLGGAVLYLGAALWVVLRPGGIQAG